MDTQTNSQDFDEDDCLCQGKVPKNKRIDIEQLLPMDKNGNRLRDGGEPAMQNGNPVKKWFPVMRSHADCTIHGVTITEELKCPVD